MYLASSIVSISCSERELVIKSVVSNYEENENKTLDWAIMLIYSIPPQTLNGPKLLGSVL